MMLRHSVPLLLLPASFALLAYPHTVLALLMSLLAHAIWWCVYVCVCVCVCVCALVVVSCSSPLELDLIVDGSWC